MAISGSNGSRFQGIKSKIGWAGKKHVLRRSVAQIAKERIANIPDLSSEEGKSKLDSILKETINYKSGASSRRSYMLKKKREIEQKNVSDEPDDACDNQLCTS